LARAGSAARRCGALDEQEIALSRGLPEPAKGVLLGELERRHQKAFRALDELAILECLLSSADFRLERLELGLS
jgi:hypothetical protein